MLIPKPVFRSDVTLLQAFTRPERPPRFYAYRNAVNAPVWHGPSGDLVPSLSYGDLINDDGYTACPKCRVMRAPDDLCTCERSQAQHRLDITTARAESAASAYDPPADQYEGDPARGLSIACLGCITGLFAVAAVVALLLLHGVHSRQEQKGAQEFRAMYGQKGDIRK